MFFHHAARMLVAVAALIVCGLPVAAQTPTAEALAASIQTHYATVHDFVAEFSQTQSSALMVRPSENRGVVEIKKPGRMRWTWTTNDKQVMVADGLELYLYFPKDRYVSIEPLPHGDSAPTAFLFLAGRGNLTRDFVPALSADQPDTEWHLDVTPKAPQADFKSLTIEVDRRTFELKGLVTVDAQDTRSSFRFGNMRENQGIADHDFEFTPPAGVEIRR